MTGAGPDELGRLVLTAHGDAWAEQGDLRARWGGATTELPGIRLMRSGLPHPQWNNGDVHDAERVDVDAVRAWYAEAGVPWGVRVPADTEWHAGRHLFRKRAMGLRVGWWKPAGGPYGVRLRTATPADLDDVVEVDATAFGDPVEQNRPWVEPHLSSARCRVVVAEADGAVVGCATGTRSDGWAGPAVMVTGVAVAEPFRRRGIGAALTSALVDWAFEGGATLVHLNPDDDAAARLYAGLGFVEVAGFDVYVDL
jgi:ribosomal protein S18 acetylase RimI-like enzyme